MNSVLLRQNPHNVREWMSRIHLHEESLDLQMETFEESVRTVDPKSQTGSFADLWVMVAKLLEKAGDFEKARNIFERAVLIPFAKIDELARVWCEYVEFQLRHGDYPNTSSTLTIKRKSKTACSNRFDCGLFMPILKKAWAPWTLAAQSMTV
jgi:tetratricopeptide (TPR) repeat protein